MSEYTAGRDLDALVAELVFGWKPLSGNEIPEEITPRKAYEPHLKRVWVKDGKSVACEECGTLPPFSTDIAAAWQVVEKLSERGLTTVVTTPAPGGTTWDVRGWNSETNTDRFIAHANTAPLAICLAALKAIETVTDAPSTKEEGE